MVDRGIQPNKQPLAHWNFPSLSLLARWLRLECLDEILIWCRSKVLEFGESFSCCVFLLGNSAIFLVHVTWPAGLFTIASNRKVHWFKSLLKYPLIHIGPSLRGEKSWLGIRESPGQNKLRLVAQLSNTIISQEKIHLLHSYITLSHHVLMNM